MTFIFLPFDVMSVVLSRRLLYVTWPTHLFQVSLSLYQAAILLQSFSFVHIK